MNCGVNQFKRIVLTEGQVQWIAERNTPEERLAAWDAITELMIGALAYDMPVPYVGNDACGRTKRDSYLLFKDSIRTNDCDLQMQGKNPRRVAAGLAGASKRYGKQYGSSSTSVTDSSLSGEIADCPPEQKTSKEEKLQAHSIPSQIVNDDFTSWAAGDSQKLKELTEADKKRIEELDKKFPDATSLQKYLESTYFLPNKTLVTSIAFCEYAWVTLAQEQRWVYQKTKKPIRNVNTAIHWLAIRFMELEGDIKRATVIEKKKDIETDFALKVAQQERVDERELAARERVERIKAERAMAERRLAEDRANEERTRKSCGNQKK